VPPHAGMCSDLLIIFFVSFFVCLSTIKFSSDRCFCLCVGRASSATSVACLRAASSASSCSTSVWRKSRSNFVPQCFPRFFRLTSVESSFSSSLSSHLPFLSSFLQLAEFATASKKKTREICYSMLRSQFVTLQEVPRGHDRNPGMHSPHTTESEREKTQHKEAEAWKPSFGWMS